MQRKILTGAVAAAALLLGAAAPAPEATTTQADCQFYFHDGGERWLECMKNSVTPVYNPPNLPYYVKHDVDVTFTGTGVRASASASVHETATDDQVFGVDPGETCVDLSGCSE